MNTPVDRRRPPAGPQLAYVLHAYDWKESSLILDLFTREEGRVVCVAKGAKRPYSQLRAVLLPFQCVQVSLTRAKAQADGDAVRTLKTAEWAAGSAVLDAAHLLKGFYLNELLMKFLPRSAAHSSLFDIYHHGLRTIAVATDESSVQGVLRAFEMSILMDMGLLPDLAHDTLSGEAPAPEQRYGLQAELGLVRVDDERASLFGAQWLALQAALSSGHWTALHGLSSTMRSPLRMALRAVLAYHLSGSPLRTRGVVQALQRLGISPVSNPVQVSNHEPLDA